MITWASPLSGSPRRSFDPSLRTAHFHDRRVTIVLEHIPFGGGEQLENIAAIMEKVPPLRLHLDSGHAKLERGYDRWDEYLDCLGTKRVLFCPGAE